MGLDVLGSWLQQRWAGAATRGSLQGWCSVGAKGGEWGASKAVWGLPKHKRGGLGVTRARCISPNACPLLWELALVNCAAAGFLMLSCASCLLILVARPQIPNSGD